MESKQKPVQTASSDTVRNLKQAFERAYEIDRGLPTWARRSHPIVRRHLGMFWRVLPPQIDIVARNALVFALVVLLTIAIPFLYTVLLPLSLLSLAILPFALIFYARALYDLATDSSRAMVREIEGNTLPLLLVTPIETRDVLLSKIAGTLWRQSDSMSLLMNIVLYSQLPGVMVIYINIYPQESFGVLTQIITVLVYLASIARIPLEMFMVTAIGQYIGLTTRGRSAATASTIGLLVFYFAMLNAMRFLPLSPVGDILVNAVLPLTLPPLVSTIAVWLSLRALKD